MIKLTFPIYYTQEFKTKKPKTFLLGLNWYRNSKFTKIRIIYKVYAGRNGTDGHNIRAVMEKFICDGLVECGALPDDSIEYLRGDESYYFISKENPRIEVEIEQL